MQARAGRDQARCRYLAACGLCVASCFGAEHWNSGTTMRFGYWSQDSRFPGLLGYSPCETQMYAYRDLLYFVGPQEIRDSFWGDPFTKVT